MLRRWSCCLIAVALAAGCKAPVSPRMNILPPEEGEPDAGAPSTPRPDAATSKPDAAALAKDTAPDLAPDVALPPDAGPIAASGVKVGLVEASQAVFVKIGEGDKVVPTLDRNAALIEKRALFLRVHVVTESGWMARPLRAVLTLAVAGEEQTLEDTRMIAGSSDTQKLESSFNFLVPAAMVKPTTEISVELFEAGSFAGKPPGAPPRFPVEGGADLGIKAGRMVMDVVLVQVSGPSGPLDDSPARRKHLESYLGDVYPVQELNVTWREPIKITAKLGWMAAFKMLQQARIEDDAKPGTYYHMLLAKEDSNDAFLGLGSLAGSTVTDAPNRIAMTNVSKHAVDGEMDTVSHEMGHNLGRNHAPGCNAQGVDERFPYPNTGVGVDGYSIPEAAFKSRLKWKDVMGYCYPTWISDYTWNGFERRQRVISAYPSTMPFQQARSLQGFQAPGSNGEWGVVPGALVEGGAATAQRQARITLASGGTRVVPIDLRLLRSPAGPEPGARQIAVNLPDEEVAAVEVLIDGERLVVPAEVLHR
ncbi:MAG TPA: zinc-dependent metalloprotease family protein [Polyangia bacterium]|nr:zinc-dependent metalloprotease family protein [Polyangia bacterium]